MPQEGSAEICAITLDSFHFATRLFVMLRATFACILPHQNRFEVRWVPDLVAIHPGSCQGRPLDGHFK
jgi:hypothetical protein